MNLTPTELDRLTIFTAAEIDEPVGEQFRQAPKHRREDVAWDAQRRSPGVAHQSQGTAEDEPALTR